jgi:hypothetical protein
MQLGPIWWDETSEILFDGLVHLQHDQPKAGYGRLGQLVGKGAH